MKIFMKDGKGLGPKINSRKQKHIFATANFVSIFAPA